MKKVLFLCVAACLVFFTCNKDDDPVTKDITVALTAHTDMSLAPVQCLPAEPVEFFVAGGGLLTGEVSEIGTLVKDASPYTVTSCDFGPGANQITEKLDVRMTGADGDYLTVEGTFIITTGPEGPVDMEGEAVIMGGTGKFANAFGEITIDPGSLVVDVTQMTLSWTGSGEITYP